MVKKIKVKGVKKESKAVAPVLGVSKWKKLMDEATTPEKREEYRFWMETDMGLNPSLPSHMH